MNFIKTTHNRRSFLEASALAGGGFVLGFNWQAGARATGIGDVSDTVYDINAFLKISRDGRVTIISPNLEIDHKVKTSMLMVVAKEMDVAWDMVILERPDLDSATFKGQLAAGSQHVEEEWASLRMAGATARRMLLQAAANRWCIPVSELTTDSGTIMHRKTWRSIGYGDVASDAARLQVPEEVTLNDLGHKIKGARM